MRICLYVEWDTSYVSFTYTKGREETAEQVWFLLLLFLVFLLTPWRSQRMNDVVLHLSAPAAGLRRNALSLILGKQQEPSGLIYGLGDFSIWPHLSCALL